jgi:hypothetical protein
MRRTVATLICLLCLTVPSYAVTIDSGRLAGGAISDFLIFNLPPLSGEGVTITNYGAQLFGFERFTFPSPVEGQPFNLGNSIRFGPRTTVSVGGRRCSRATPRALRLETLRP